MREEETVGGEERRGGEDIKEDERRQSKGNGRIERKEEMRVKRWRRQYARENAEKK